MLAFSLPRRPSQALKRNDVEAESSENACIIVEVRSEYSKAAGPKLYKSYSESPRTPLDDASSETNYGRRVPRASS